MKSVSDSILPSKKKLEDLNKKWMILSTSISLKSSSVSNWSFWIDFKMAIASKPTTRLKIIHKKVHLHFMNLLSRSISPSRRKGNFTVPNSCRRAGLAQISRYSIPTMLHIDMRKSLLTATSLYDSFFKFFCFIYASKDSVRSCLVASSRMKVFI